MTANLKPYPNMRHSGVPWLGCVPAHWPVRSLTQIGSITKGSGGNKDDEISAGIPCVRYGDLYTTHDVSIRESRSSVPKEKAAGYTAIKFGDVLFAGSGETLSDIGKSAVNLMRQDAVCGGDVVLFRPAQPVDARYMGYALDCRPSAVQKATMGRGITIMHIYGAQLRYLTIPVPPLAEQAAIARFLDYADRRIRRCLAAKLKLISLLPEQRRVIIHHAVTGQIDVRTGRPYAARKPSRLSWAGDVPAHWPVASLRHRYHQCLGKMLDSSRITGSDPVPYLRNADVQWDRINVEDLPTMDIAPSEYERYTVRRGDLLVCEGGEMGRAALWANELPVCGYQKALHRLRPRSARRDLARFLYYALRCAADGRAFADGQFATIPHLTGDKLRAHRFPFPPLAEQEAIVRFLDRENRMIDAAIDGARRQVTMLSDYRSRLIADLVTGRLDVRQAAAALPNTEA